MQGLARQKTTLTEKQKEYETLKNMQENVEQQLKQLKREEEIILNLIKLQEVKQAKIKKQANLNPNNFLSLDQPVRK